MNFINILAKLQPHQISLVRRQQKQLLSLSQDGLSMMGPHLEAAKDALKTQLSSSLVRTPEGTLAWDATSYKATRNVVKGIAHRIETNLHETLKVTTRQAQELATRHLETKFSRIAGQAFTTEGHAQEISASVRPQIESVSARIGSSRGPRGIEAAVQRDVTSDILQESEVVDTIKGLGLIDAEIAEEVALDAEVAADAITESLFDRFTSWIEAALRTENVSTYEAQTELGLQEAAAQGIVEQKVWVADGSNTCAICDSLDGQVQDVGDDFEDDDGETYDGPPAHPNCMCSIAPYTSDENEEE